MSGGGSALKAWLESEDEARPTPRAAPAADPDPGNNRGVEKC